MLTIFKTPVKGKGFYLLSRQLIATELNIANGADDSATAGVIADAHALIAVKGMSLKPGQVSALADALADFNEGQTGPGHCDD